MSKENNKLTIGTLFRQKREEKGLLVRQVAAVIEVDQAIISRIENNDRLPTKEQLLKLSGLYGLNQREILSVWLAEKIVKEYGDEPYAPKAFEQAYHQILFNKGRIKNEDDDSITGKQ
ncbi:MAG: helix-turn-helix transcriptional regulator [Lentimicrobium sp.]|jgi:transcriptional regulator with XRE-family HTH domain|nr:helix-turn-helix transcriptional regulator [Lentimicrobium sp.]